MSSGALILTYHAIEEGPGPLFTAPALFERQLDCIAAAGVRTVTISSLAAAIRSGDPLDGSVAITFDDGFASVAETAWPLLAARGLTATVFCIAAYLGRESDWPTQPPAAPRRPLAGADELVELAAEGLEIGSHGATHAPLDRDDPGFLERELHGSRELLERTLGVPVQTLAWPYGLRSEAAERAARDAGYATACGGSGGRVRLRDPLFALPRVDAHYLRRPALLRATLRGSGTAYLGARRAGARARRLLLKDYATKGAA